MDFALCNDSPIFIEILFMDTTEEENPSRRRRILKRFVSSPHLGAIFEQVLPLNKG